MKGRRAVAVLALCCAALVTLLGAAAGTAEAGQAPARHVVVVGVPGLRWDDVTANGTPFLWQLAERSSVGALTVRSAVGTTRRADGWLTLGAGNRAFAPTPGLTPDQRAAALPDPRDPAELARLARANRDSHFAAHVGALGGALRDAGVSTAVVGGAGARLGATDQSGDVGATAPSVSAGLRSATVVFDELPAAYAAPDGPARVAALAEVDTRLRDAATALGPDDLLVVVGVSARATGRDQLTVAIAHGRGFDRRWLASPSTQRAPFVQLIDVAPTVLQALGLPLPASMNGRAWHAAGSPLPGATAPAADRLRALAVQSDQQLRLSRHFPRAFLLVGIAFAVWVAVAWRRRTPPSRLAPVATAVAALPVSAWLVQVAPWWRWGLWTAYALTAAWALALGQLALRGPWRRHPWGPAAFLGGLSFLVIAVDVATGSHLQLDAPFGDNPVIAGRFRGVGNAAFAVLSAGALTVAAALARGRSRTRAALVVSGVGLVAVVVDGFPSLGDDFGGVLALLPAVLVLVLVVARLRPSVPRLAIVVGVGAAAAIGFALFDYSRPLAQQTHLGRFVGQLTDGTAWTVVHRKLDATLATFRRGYFRWSSLADLLLAGWAWRLWRQGRLSVPLPDRLAVAGLGAAALTAGLLGAALNDSGLAVSALCWYVVTPLLVLRVTPVVEPLAQPRPDHPAVLPALDPADGEARAT